MENDRQITDADNCTVVFVQQVQFEREIKYQKCLIVHQSILSNSTFISFHSFITGFYSILPIFLFFSPFLVQRLLYNYSFFFLSPFPIKYGSQTGGTIFDLLSHLVGRQYLFTPLLKCAVECDERECEELSLLFFCLSFGCFFFFDFFPFVILFHEPGQQSSGVDC